MLSVLDNNPSLLYRPWDLVAKGILGRKVSIENIFEACETIFVGGQADDRNCAIRLCLEALLALKCAIKGNIGADFVKAMQKCKKASIWVAVKQEWPGG